jgi:agmatine deiminase
MEMSAASAVSDLPKSLGYTMPAEWEPHSKTWMAWPYSPKVWRSTNTNTTITDEGNSIRHGEEVPAQKAFTNIVKAIAAFEPVYVGARVEDIEKVTAVFATAPNVVVFPLEYNDSWLRDTGPTFIINRSSGDKAGIDWKFNCWGEIGKQDDVEGLPYEKDCTVAAQILGREGHSVCRTFEAPFVMEGGAVNMLY